MYGVAVTHTATYVSSDEKATLYPGPAGNRSGFAILVNPPSTLEANPIALANYGYTVYVTVLPSHGNQTGGYLVLGSLAKIMSPTSVPPPRLAKSSTSNIL